MSPHVFIDGIYSFSVVNRCTPYLDKDNWFVEQVKSARSTSVSIAAVLSTIPPRFHHTLQEWDCYYQRDPTRSHTSNQNSTIGHRLQCNRDIAYVTMVSLNQKRMLSIILAIINSLMIAYHLTGDVLEQPQFISKRESLQAFQDHGLHVASDHSDLLLEEKVQEAIANEKLVLATAGLDINSGVFLGGLDYFCLEWDQQLINIDDWWTHHPEHLADEYNTTHQCFRKVVSQEHLQLLKRFYQNQFQSGCDNPYKRPLRSAGWGSDFNGLTEGLFRALELRKPMLVVPPPWFPRGQGWLYAVLADGSGPTCRSQDTQCYFLPIINPACMANLSISDLDSTGMDNENYGVFHRNDSLFQWSYHYATRGQSWLRREVAIFLETQGPHFPAEESCSVIHVRRGDVILEADEAYARGYHAVSEYLDLLPEERRQVGSNIIIFTDDANAVDEARLLHKDFNWHWFNRTRNRGKRMEFGKHIVAATAKDDVVVILATFEVAKRCDAIVTGKGGLSFLLRREVRVAWMERGRSLFEATVQESSLSGEDRRRSDLLLEEKVQEAIANEKLVLASML